jgi:hypothetical protein
MQTKVLILLLLAITFTVSNLSAQDEFDYKFNIAGFDINLSIPGGIFGKNLDNMVIGGAGFHYLRQYAPDKPFFIGGRLGYQYLTGTEAAIARINPSGIEELWDGKTNSQFVKLNGTARYYIDIGRGKITPYLQASVGWNWFYTSTYLSFRDSDESVFDIEKSDIAFNYSGGAGANYALDYNWHLNFSMELDNGQASFYYVRRDENYEPLNSPVEKMALKKSVTNYIGWTLGVMYRW